MTNRGHQLPDSSSSPPNSQQFGYSAGGAGGAAGPDLSDDEMTDLPSCAFASRPASNSSGMQHHYLASLHHSAESPCNGAGAGVGGVLPPSGGGGTEYYGSSPYRVQRHAANIRERKRMLRSAIGPTGYNLSCQYKLRFRRAAHARAHLPVRKEAQQNRHPAIGHRVHCAAQRSSHG
nr:unnamed protein product [Callosobruchus chinensis]